MASLKSIALVLAVSLLSVSMVTSTAQAGPAQNKAAAEKKRTGNRNAYLVSRMTSQGISKAKALMVVSSINRYEKDFQRAHKRMSVARAKLRDRTTANDRMARIHLDNEKKQLEHFKRRYRGELTRTLTAGERAKVAQILGPPPKAKGKGKGKGKSAKRGKSKSQRKRS